MASKSDSSVSSGGIGFSGLLALLFIALKLTGHIDWSWWWVLCPFWIPIGILIMVAVVALLIGGALKLAEAISVRRARAKLFREN